MKQLACSVLAVLAGFLSAVAVAQVSSDGEAIDAKPVAAVPAEAVKGTPTSPLYFSEDDTGSLYTLNPSTGAATNIGVSGVTDTTVGLALRDAVTLWGSTWEDIVIINADGSGFTTIAVGTEVEGLAYDCQTDTLYGGINSEFFTINTTTGARDTVLSSGPADEDFEGLAFGNGGVYALAEESGLFFYDPVTDSWSLVGDTGIDWDQSGLAYDSGSDTLYAKGDQDSNLYRINPASAATTLVGNTGLDEGGGLTWNECNNVIVPTMQPVGLLVLLLVLGLATVVVWRRRQIS